MCHFAFARDDANTARTKASDEARASSRDVSVSVFALAAAGCARAVVAGVRRSSLITDMLQLLATLPLSNENGLARTPPLGWRSWNLYGANVNQSLIEGIMDGMVRKDRKVDGVPTSLCDLGYCDVGLDDNWQKCSPPGSVGARYHDPSGKPLVNTERFPDMAAMTAHAHKLGLTAGWCMNNCNPTPYPSPNPKPKPNRAYPLFNTQGTGTTASARRHGRANGSSMRATSRRCATPNLRPYSSP